MFMCAQYRAVMRSSLALWLLTFVTFADDWPQWMGPKRDSEWRETGLLETFPADGAKILWRTPINSGYSGPAVLKGQVFVMDFVATAGTSNLDFNNRDRRTGKERVLCLDATTGKEKWKFEYDCQYNMSYATGPRCTPTVADGKVYALGAEGHLNCLNAANGKLHWSHDLKQEYKAETPMWGFCGHPLVEGKRLFCLVGGEGSVAVAFDKDSGKEVWRALSARESGYCPPTMIEFGGKRQLLIWHAEAINSLHPNTGKVYWSVPCVPSYGMSIAAPRSLGNLLYVSGIRDVSLVLRLAADRPMAEEVWRGDNTMAVNCSNSTPFLQDGMVYGTDCNSGHLRCVKLATGERVWETLVPTSGGERRAPHGTAFIVKQGDRFVLFSETGHLILAHLTPQGYQEMSRAKILEPTGRAFGREVVWSHPAFANRCAYVRNDKEIVCVSMAAEK